jgi:hypothetical protein
MSSTHLRSDVQFDKIQERVLLEHPSRPRIGTTVQKVVVCTALPGKRQGRLASCLARKTAFGASKNSTPYVLKSRLQDCFAEDTILKLGKSPVQSCDQKK